MLISSSKTFAVLWRILAAAIGILLITSGIVMAGGGAGVGQSDPNTSGQDPIPSELTYVPNQIVVKFAPWADPGVLINNGFATGVSRQLNQSGVYLLETEPGMDYFALESDLDTMSAVIYSHPNYVVNRLHPVQGSYPFSDEQYVGDFALQRAATMLNLDNSHQTATGAGITVAVLDGGVDASYTELAGVVLPGWDYVGADGDPFDEDGGQSSGHGTFVAGIVHLAAPDALIKPYRVIDPRGYGDGFTLAMAIEQAVVDGCDVINISLVLMEEHLAVRDAITFAEAQGVVVVASAGNESDASNLFPAAYDNVISVAAIDSTMLLADFASYGANVDICAPGTMIYSTYKDGLYAWWSGSSFAAPLVAGQVAMLKEVSPASSNLLLEYAITVTGTDIDDINPDVSGQLGGGLTDPPASLNQIDGLAIADVAPDTVYIDLYEGRSYFTDPSVGAFLTSTNAPAAYTVEVVDDGAIFSTVTTPSGMTNDSVQVSIQPDGLELGIHYDEVLYTVDGVPDPVSLTICATMNPPDTSQTAWLSHPVLNFQATVGTDETQTIPVILSSSNAPAGFSAVVLPGGAQFTTVLNPAGNTNDSVMIQVNPSDMPVAGNYLDSVMCTVAGVVDPVYLEVWLNLTDGGGGGDSAWVFADSGSVFVIAEGAVGSAGTRTGCIDVMSSNAPANFAVTLADPPDFIALDYTTGQTDGSFCFEVNVGTLSLGNYKDTMQVWVDGCANSPINVEVTLLVVPPGSEDPDSCWVSPMFHGYAAPAGVDSVAIGTFAISSTVTPSAYTISSVDPPDFIGVTSPTGFTNDLVGFTITSTASMAPGVYHDTLSVEVDGAINSPVRVIFFLVVQPEPGDSLYLTPELIEFHVEDGTTTPVIVNSWLSSTASPMNYTGWLDTVSTLWMTLNNTSGVTDENVSVTVDPSGFTTGVYVGQAYFDSPDADNLAILTIRMFVDSVALPPPDETAWATPNQLWLTAEEGSTTPVQASVELESSNAPAWWVGWSMNASGLDFVFVPDSSGQTNGTVPIMADPTGLGTGPYADTVLFSVAGVQEQVMVVVNLTIDAGTKAPLGVQNFPNPFNPSTDIHFSLGAASRVNLTVYNITGQAVTTLVDQHLEAGEHSFQFDGSNVSSGVYFYRLQTETAVETRKMILLK